MKQQFKGFSVSNSEGLHKGYDRFQSLLSQLEIHGAGVSTEDANQKFLRSLPSSWSQVSLIMRTKPGVDNLSFDDLYNNLKDFETDVKGSTGSSSSAQNVAFVSSKSTSSTNDVSTAYGATTSSGYNSQRENSSSYTDELMHSFFANQSSGPQLDHEDLEQIDGFDLEEIDLKWQKEPKALVTLDGDGVDWTGHAEDEQENLKLDLLLSHCHVTPLFPNMLVQAVVDEGEVLRDSLEGTNGCKGDQLQSSNDKPHSGGNISKRAEGGLNLQVLHNTCTLLSQQVLDLQKAKDTRAAEIFKLKKIIKKLEKKCKPSITHHKAWLRSVSRLSMKKMLDLDADLAHGMDYMETEEAVNEGRQSNEIEELNLDVDTKVIAEDQGSGEKGGSTVSTARPKVDTIRPNVDAARQEVSAIEPRTLPTTTSIFDDEDITMAQTLINMKEEKAKEKGVAFKDVEDSSRPARSVLTLKPLPSIDPKDKGNGILVVEEPIKIKRKDQGIYHIKRDEELAHKLHEEELAEIARIQDEKAAQEEASRVAIIEMFDEVQAAAQRKFRAVQRAAEIRTKTFEEIQAMYERQKKIIYDFKPMDSDDAVKDSKKAGGEDTSKEEVQRRRRFYKHAKQD
ncbi:hypothetical protein Tco_1113455 [Tanacetum coccineum]|uniref:Uncharacterized protein n=1 Tax=Tanacetum coccineum TaxID=301880 RepID=A0ABQ5ISA7_9ASTR